MKKFFIFLCLITVISLGVGLTIKYIHDGSETLSEVDSLENTKELIAQANYEEAKDVIQQHLQSTQGDPELVKDWLDLSLTVIEQLKDTPELMLFFQRYPDLFESHEQGSILAARGFLLLRQAEDFETIRNMWRGKETDKKAWFIVDVDFFITTNRRDDAFQLLESEELEGEYEIGRLVRLALLKSGVDVNDSWDYLARAYQINPSNPEVRTYRGRILENLGKLNLARIEYEEVAHKNPDNPLLLDQLGDFYARHDNYKGALDAWQKALNIFPIHSIVIKSLFWSRMAHPQSVDVTLKEEMEDDLVPFVHFLRALPAGAYWDDFSFSEIEGAKNILSHRQESFWLRLVQLMKDGKEKEALALLEINPFSQFVWHSHIENALRHILTYRATGRFADATLYPILTESELGASEDIHTFFVELDQMVKTVRLDLPGNSLPKEWNKLLRSNEGFASTFIAGFWVEAGLNFIDEGTDLQEMPSWVPYVLCKAIQANRNDIEALAFAENQEETPLMLLLRGELEMTTGNPQEGVQKVASVAGMNSIIGFRASWILSLAFLESGDPTTAKQIIDAQPLLKEHIIGQEMLARCALNQEDIDEATKIYIKIQDSSLEAKSFLARKAYKNKDYETAERLTQEALHLAPSSSTLRLNLQLIKGME